MFTHKADICFALIAGKLKKSKTTYGSECALLHWLWMSLLEYARLYLEGNLQMWVDAEDSLEL